MVKDQPYAYMCIYTCNILDFLQIEMVKQNLYPLPALWPAACARLRRLPLIRKSRPGRLWGKIYGPLLAILMEKMMWWKTGFLGCPMFLDNPWISMRIPDDLACGWRSLELRMHQDKKALALAVPTCQECMMRPEVDERRLPCDWRGLLKVSELAESFKFVQRLWVCVWGVLGRVACDSSFSVIEMSQFSFNFQTTPPRWNCAEVSEQTNEG